MRTTYGVLMRFTEERICFQEVPGEIALGFTISGCPVGCKGCHSAETWSPKAGQVLTPGYLLKRLQDYQGLISCVLFLGGEWHTHILRHYLQLAQERGLQTCLYTGYDDVPVALKEQLTYLKTGPWRAELGGLDSLTTNQRFYDLRTHQCLNHAFQSAAQAAATLKR